MLEPGETFLGHKVITVALETLARIVHLDEIRVVVSALPGQDFPIIEADRVRVEMPLADHCSGVAGFAEKIGESGLKAIKVGGIIIDEAV